MKSKKVANYKGEMVTPPADLYQHVAVHADGLIVWSRRGNLHQVRYGLQVRRFDCQIKACHEYGECVRHYAECECLLDTF